MGYVSAKPDLLQLWGRDPHSSPTEYISLRVVELEGEAPELREAEEHVQHILVGLPLVHGALRPDARHGHVDGYGDDVLVRAHAQVRLAHHEEPGVEVVGPLAERRGGEARAPGQARLEELHDVLLDQHVPGVDVHYRSAEAVCEQLQALVEHVCVGLVGELPPQSAILKSEISLVWHEGRLQRRDKKGLRVKFEQALFCACLELFPLQLLHH
mmetsp:Transcript_58772/g.165828  ORF Transcript_58772/g.165828 Transcript_58772/m.165828 type:complete len:213 (+) Transcript_58772:842-1480(+)